MRLKITLALASAIRDIALHSTARATTFSSNLPLAQLARTNANHDEGWLRLGALICSYSRKSVSL